MKPNEDDTVEVFAIWEYNSHDEYVRIESNIKADEPHVARIKDWYELHGGRDYIFNTLILEVRNDALVSTVNTEV